MKIYKGLTALMAASALAVGCERKLITEPSSRHRVVNLETPYNEKGVSLDQFSPNKHTKWDMKMEGIYETLYESVRNKSPEANEADIAFRPVLASNLRTDASTLENRLVSNVIYVGKKVIDKDGNPVTEWPISTEGQYGVKAEINLPNLTEVPLAIHNMNQADIKYKVWLLKVEAKERDSNGLERTVTQWYGVPLISQAKLETFKSSFNKYLDNKRDPSADADAPANLPFVAVGPLSITTNNRGETVLPNSDVDLYTGQVTLHDDAYIFIAMPNNEFEARKPAINASLTPTSSDDFVGPPAPLKEESHKTPTGSVDPLLEEIINAQLEKVKVGPSD